MRYRWRFGRRRILGINASEINAREPNIDRLAISKGLTNIRASWEYGSPVLRIGASNGGLVGFLAAAAVVSVAGFLGRNELRDRKQALVQGIVEEFDRAFALLRDGIDRHVSKTEAQLTSSVQASFKRNVSTISEMSGR